MKKTQILLSALCSAFLAISMLSAANPPKTLTGHTLRLYASDAEVNPERAETVKNGVRLKSGIGRITGSSDLTGDVSYSVRLPEGSYKIRTFSAVEPAIYEKLRKLNKFGALRTDLAVAGAQKHDLCIVCPWHNPKDANSYLGKFFFPGGVQKISFFLPSGVTLKQVAIEPYNPPSVPKEAMQYIPKLVPSPERPRLLVTHETLETVRRHLSMGENAPVWKFTLEKAAETPNVKLLPNGTMTYDPELERLILCKAFVSLMKNDPKPGREAIELADQYLQRVNFGNILDITREIGQAIHTAAYTYDWCYPLLTPEEKARFQKNFFRLAEDMECGWPPFQQSIINGHGNENQITRDLFAMSVAIYDENPEPYRICAYRILEELSPAHTYEYGAGRHSQGTSYGLSRFSCDMYGAWNIKRTLQFDLFGDTLKRVPYSWLYMRLPNGEIMHDGDDFMEPMQQKRGYWANPRTMFLCASYNHDPYLKGEFLRMSNRVAPLWMPMEYLCFNDPELAPIFDRSSLPLTYAMKPPYPAMLARTGWDFGKNANDAVVYLTGAGLNSFNHQHLNAGDFQIYYRGFLASDLGTYKFYGTPYDMNFNKQSVAHNVMRFADPKNSKDHGGQIYRSGTPMTMAKMEDSRNGRLLASDYGPNRERPLFNYFKNDLARAYPENRISAYERTVFALNNANPARPMTVVVFDRVAAAKEGLTKSWQIGSLTVPSEKDGRFEILSLNGEGKLTLDPIFPATRKEIFSGAESHKICGIQYVQPNPQLPEANGSRLVLSSKNGPREENFLNVMQISRGGETAAKPVFSELPGKIGRLELPGWTLLWSLSGEKITTLTLDPPPQNGRVLIADMEPGDYDVTDTGRIHVGSEGTMFFPACEDVPPADRKRVRDFRALTAPVAKPTSIHFVK